MNAYHLLFLFAIVASQVGLAKSDDVLNKDLALRRNTVEEREL